MPLFGHACEQAVVTQRGVYATFWAASRRYGAPAVYLAGYLPRDGGASWQPVPVP